MADEKISLEILIETANSAETVEELRQSIIDLNKGIRDVKIGTEEFTQVQNALIIQNNKLKEALDKAKEASKAQAMAFDQVGNAVGVVNPQLGFMIKFLGNIKQGFKGVLTAAKAFIASPIGLTITAVTALLSPLIAFLTKTKEGMELVERATNVVNATMSVFIDRLSSIGKAFVDFFSGEASFRETLSSVAEGFSGITTEIKKEIVVIDELTKAEQRLRDQQREDLVLNAERRSEIKRLNLIAEDLTKTEQERIDAAQKAFELETQVFKTREDRINKEIELLEARQNTSKELEEDEQQLAELQAKRFQLQEESLERQTTINNKLNVIRQQAQAKRQAAIDEETAKLEEAAQKEIELTRLIEETKTNLIEDEEQRKIQILSDQFNLRIEQLREQFGVQTELETLLLQERNNAIEAVEKEFEEKRQTEVEARNKKEAEKRKAEADKQLEEAQLIAQARIQIEQSVVSSLSSLGNLFIKNQEKNEAFQKSLAVVQIGIDTAKAISGAIANAQGQPFPANLAAIATSVAAVLSGIGQAKAVLSKVGNTQAPNLTVPSGASVPSVGLPQQQVPTIPQTALIPPDNQTQIVLPVESFNEVNGQIVDVSGLAEIG